MHYQKQTGGKMGLIAIIRLRGSAKKDGEVNYALQIMGLTRVNHCVVLENDAYLKGQLYKVKDYVTYGEIDKETLKSLVTKRVRLEGDKKITDAFLKEKKINIDGIVDLYSKDKKKLSELGIKKVFRLSPASKGLKSIKLAFGHGGDLGNRGKEINTLLNKMI
jgi:large subunit ribosomal protein L30